MKYRHLTYGLLFSVFTLASAPCLADDATDKFTQNFKFIPLEKPSAAITGLRIFARDKSDVTKFYTIGPLKDFVVGTFQQPVAEQVPPDYYTINEELDIKAHAEATFAFTMLSGLDLLKKIGITLPDIQAGIQLGYYYKFNSTVRMSAQDYEEVLQDSLHSVKINPGLIRQRMRPGSDPDQLLVSNAFLRAHKYDFTVQKSIDAHLDAQGAPVKIGASVNYTQLTNNQFPEGKDANYDKGIVIGVRLTQAKINGDQLDLGAEEPEAGRVYAIPANELPRTGSLKAQMRKTHRLADLVFTRGIAQQ